MSKEENQSNQPDLIAYAVSEKGEKTFYHRIGAGWQNKGFLAQTVNFLH